MQQHTKYIGQKLIGNQTLHQRWGIFVLGYITICQVAFSDYGTIVKPFPLIICKHLFVEFICHLFIQELKEAYVEYSLQLLLPYQQCFDVGWTKRKLRSPNELSWLRVDQSLGELGPVKKQHFSGQGSYQYQLSFNILLKK